MAEDRQGKALRTGETVGILGGGQLGRMLAMAARRLGYRVLIFEPEAGCPAAAVADDQIGARWDDENALSDFASRCSVVTYEFENVPLETARFLQQRVVVLPSPLSLERSQDRLVEKDFLNSLGVATAPYAAIADAGDLAPALGALGGAGRLKTRRMGYDGKGQVPLRAGDVPREALDLVAAAPCILEGRVAFDCEISVVAARDAQGGFAAYEPSLNRHEGGILRSSTAPAGVSAATAQRAMAIARRIAEALDHVGALAVEFFVIGDDLLVNEIAPRVHNSGHWTEAACLVSQFEQHVRAICGLPLGSAARHSDCVMENLIGRDVDKVDSLLAAGDVLVHLYGKGEVREGRKMGHFTRLTAPSVRR